MRVLMTSTHPSRLACVVLVQLGVVSVRTVSDSMRYAGLAPESRRLMRWSATSAALPPIYPPKRLGSAVSAQTLGLPRPLQTSSVRHLP